MRILTKNGYIDSVGVFFELTDEQLDIIKNDMLYFYNKKLIDEFNASKGDNAHFSCAWNNEDGSIIRNSVKELLKEYKTVSWWDENLRQFQITRR